MFCLPRHTFVRNRFENIHASRPCRHRLFPFACENNSATLVPMVRLLRLLMLWPARLLLSLRYRIRVEGLEQVRGLDRTLILPNHPGYIDPPIVLTMLWRHLEPRPLLLGLVFQNPLLFWIPRLLDAVVLGRLDQTSSHGRQQAEAAVETIATGLRKGRNQILWPAGRVQRDGREVLPATRSAAQILKAVDDAQLVLVRTRGLWGSSFSYARTGGPPNLTACLVKGIGILLANLILFAPRRHVHITVQRIDRSQFPALTRDDLNRFLENWYNEPGVEEPTYVPYHTLFGPRDFTFPRPVATTATPSAPIAPGTRSAVREMLAEKLRRDIAQEECTPATKLEALGLDSLDRMELVLAVEQRFGFRSDQPPETVAALEALAEGVADRTPSPPPPKQWFAPIPTHEMASIDGDTIPEAFVRRATASRGDVAASDDLAGAITYERMLVGALLLAKRIRRWEGTNIGMMLPASVAADVTLCGFWMAGKLPVLLNWTTGPSGLEQSAKTMGLRTVVTSRRFVDRLDLQVPGTSYVFLEDLQAAIGRFESLWTLCRVRVRGQGMIRDTPSPNPEDPAVVLFTSGSEKAPKAVPLSHQNLLSNIRAVLDVYDLGREHAMLGFLPTFHSFGLTVTCLLPILGGIRVVHHPDPTDAGSLARKAKSYCVTLICGTPTFIQQILKHCAQGDLDSIRFVVVGAEKCPETVYDQLASVAPKAELLEGYGITECSPLISGNRPGAVRRGSVGPPLPGVEVLVVDPDTLQPTTHDTPGMLLVCGPNVFPGYIGYNGPSPFHDHDDKRWYITGDLAQRDDTGVIFFRGRLKRFLKAGGEMISLPALEEPFTAHYPQGDEGPRVAVEGIESETGRHITLFTIEAIELPEANRLLTDHGFRGVMRLDEVKRVKAIPILGTGKTDYKVLRQILENEASS